MCLLNSSKHFNAKNLTDRKNYHYTIPDVLCSGVASYGALWHVPHSTMQVFGYAYKLPNY